MSEVLKHSSDEEYNETKQTRVMQLYTPLGGCTEICRRLMGKIIASLADWKHYRSCAGVQFAYLQVIVFIKNKLAFHPPGINRGQG